MNRLLITLVLGFVLTPAIGHAQERVTIDIGYALGDLRVTREYPEGRGLVNGEKFASDGVDVSTKVRVTDIVGIGYRHEHAGLRNAMYMATKHMGDDRPYQDFVDGKAQYRELYGSFVLPGTQGHSLIVGVASSSMEY